MINEPTPFNACRYSHKFRGPCIRYEICISVEVPKICRANGPWPCGSYSDCRIFSRGIEKTFKPDGYVFPTVVIHMSVVFRLLGAITIIHACHEIFWTNGSSNWVLWKTNSGTTYHYTDIASTRIRNHVDGQRYGFNRHRTGPTDSSRRISDLGHLPNSSTRAHAAIAPAVSVPITYQGVAVVDEGEAIRKRNYESMMNEGIKQRRSVQRKVVREARRKHSRGGTAGLQNSGDTPDWFDSSNPPPASTSQQEITEMFNSVYGRREKLLMNPKAGRFLAESVVGKK